MLTEVLFGIFIVILAILLVWAIGKIPKQHRSKIEDVADALLGSERLMSAIGIPDTVVKTVHSAAQEAVMAIEQTSKNATSEKKKDLAMRYTKAMIEKLSQSDKFKDSGLDQIDDQFLDIVIESSVFIMNQAFPKNKEEGKLEDK